MRFAVNCIVMNVNPTKTKGREKLKQPSHALFLTVPAGLGIQELAAEGRRRLRLKARAAWKTANGQSRL